MKKNIVALVAAGCASGLFAMPSVSNVSMTQDQASGVVTIGYRLGGEPAVITLDVLTNGVSIGARNLRDLVDPNAGGLGSPVTRLVGVGDHTVLWRPTKTWPGYRFENGEVSVSVTAWATNQPPDYMVIDCMTKSNVWYYVDADSLPEGDVTNDVYRTTRLVMRRIPAAGVKWRMGTSSSTRYVTFTNDYYMGVYPVTYKQHELLVGSRPSWPTTSWSNEDADYRPVCRISYNSIRGTSLLWPGNGHAVDATSPLGKMRAFSGVAFDLPTDAQWEYACRAGTATKYNNGSDTFSTSIGWTSANSGLVTKPVGLKLPNNWGLYDMHGNVPEWCLDWYESPLSQTDVIEPAGAESGEARVLHGGSYGVAADIAQSYDRRSLKPNLNNKDDSYGSQRYNPGYRVACPAIAR